MLSATHSDTLTKDKTTVSTATKADRHIPPHTSPLAETSQLKCHKWCQTLFSGLRHNEQPCGPPHLSPLYLSPAPFHFLSTHTHTHTFLCLSLFQGLCLSQLLSSLPLPFCHHLALWEPRIGRDIYSRLTQASATVQMDSSEQRRR